MTALFLIYIAINGFCHVWSEVINSRILTKGSSNKFHENDLGCLCDLSLSTDIKYKYIGNWTCDGIHPINRSVACSWYGVNCDLDGSIVSLYLSNSGIRGTIPASIGNLSGLRVLDLVNNTLSSSIPSTIGLLSALSVLLLGNNMLSKALPSSIGSLTALTALDFGYNRFTSSLPESIVKLTNLVELNLNKNLFGVEGYEGTPLFYDGMANMTKLQVLQAFDNYFTGTIPEFIGKWPLKFLDLGNNMFTSSIPTFIGNLKLLTNLRMRVNFFTSSIPSTMGLLTNLKVLSLGHNSLSGAIPTSVGYMVKLTFLGLQYNNLESSIPSVIGSLTSLKTLYLFSNKLSSVIPTTIGNLKLLSQLDLSFNELTSTLPVSFFYLTNLVELYVNYNKLEGPLFHDEMAKFTELRNIAANDNKFSSSISTAIGALTNLNFLAAYLNRFTNSIPTAICTCSSLVEVFLQGNAFSGSIPYCIGRLTRVRNLLLSYNAFSSVLPTSLGDLEQLVNFHLQQNYLTSTVPSTLSKLRQVVAITLSDNKLTGTVDPNICHLSNLLVLSLANNNLACQPSCQIDGDWNSDATLSRCADGQDIALYTLERNLGVADAQARIVYSSTKVFLSPFQNPVSQVYDFCDPNAFEYDIVGSALLVSIGSSVKVCSTPECYTIQVPPRCSPTSPCFTKNFVGVHDDPDTITSLFRVVFSASQSQCYLVIENGLPGTGVYQFVVKTRSRNPSTWSFNQSVSGHVSAHRLCQDNWVGVTCEKGIVRALDLKGYALKGSLPTAIGLLWGITSLDISYNQITGSIVTALGQLSRLDTLKVTGNRLKGTVPTELGNLSSLYFADISYNFFSGSVPSVMYNLPFISFNYMDGNSFKGEVPSEMCHKVVSSNATFTLTGEPLLTCYQEECWSNAIAANRYFDPSLMMCRPTTSPSSSPTVAPSGKPIVSPSAIAGTDTTSLIIGIVFAVVFILLLAIGIIFYFTVYKAFYSNEALVKRERLAALSALPVHRMLLMDSSATEDDIIACVQDNVSTICSTDYDGNSVFDIVFNGMSVANITTRVMQDLLIHHLPLDENRELFAKIWCNAVQQDSAAVVEAVINILREYRARAVELSSVTDSLGRVCKDISSYRCKRAFYRVLCLHERYALKEGNPEHRSASSLVVFAVDCRGELPLPGNPGDLRAMKFMKFRHQYLNETNSRQEAQFNSKYVLPILHAYDGDAIDWDSKSFRKDACDKGYSDYPYCIVMDAASQSLKRVIDQQYITGNEWELIRLMTSQVASCLFHIHNKNIVHGDLKPLNVLLLNVSLRLIDFDASARIGEELGRKFSSAYIPPEMIVENSDGKCVVRVARTEVGSSDIELLRAQTSFDMWGLGCILYLMCTGTTLFQCTVDDNIYEDSDLSDLYEWSDELKQNKLSGVTNRAARHLLSMLLSKTPDHRPSANRVLAHPFITGRSSIRLPGEKATWDVFISYRVDSDDFHAEVLFEELTKTGLKVWLDSKCLQPGQSWSLEINRALIGSSLVICLLSRGAINHRMKDHQNFEKLQPNSSIDNLLVEWRLALELKERGMVDPIFPVLVGDMDTNAVYDNYLRSNCGPIAAADIPVAAVESLVGETLDQEGLGLPLKQNMTVKKVYEEILANQGSFIEGDLKDCAKRIASEVAQIKDQQVQNQIQRYKSSMHIAGDGSSTSANVARVQARYMRRLQDENKAQSLQIAQLERLMKQMSEDMSVLRQSSIK